MPAITNGTKWAWVRPDGTQTAYIYDQKWQAEKANTTIWSSDLESNIVIFGDQVETDAQLRIRNELRDRTGYSGSPGQVLTSTGDGVVWGPSTRVVSGQATVNFSTWNTEAYVDVTGLTGLSSTRSIEATIYNNSNDVYAQNWSSPLIEVISSTIFRIYIRPQVGSFNGIVLVNWVVQ